MNLIIIAFIVTYLFISFYFARNWLKFFKSSSTPTPENLFLSLIVLVLIVVSWPFLFPLYLITYSLSFVVKRLFSVKPKNTYCHQSNLALPLTVTNIYENERV